MKTSTIFTLGAVVAIVIFGAISSTAIRRSSGQHINLRFKPEAEDLSYHPGQLVTLRPGRSLAVVLRSTNDEVTVCVEDSAGGIKTQVVSSLILEKYGH